MPSRSAQPGARGDRRMPLAEAVALVDDGSTLALGGNMLYRRPAAFVYELLRRTPLPRELTLLCFTAAYESDLLVGAGCIARTRSCYFGLEAFGFAPMFTAAAQKAAITVVEETEASLALGIRAALAGVGFMPSRAWVGTDLLALRPDVKTVVDPYSGETLAAFPAIHCDVAVVHALVADKWGNTRLNANLGIDLELATLASRVIVTAEEVVDSLTEGVTLPGVLVDAVVHAPGGAWPTSCFPHYPIAGGEIVRYVEACAAGGFEAYVAEIRARGSTPPYGTGAP